MNPASILAPLTGDFGTLSAVELVLVGTACGAIGVWVLHFGRAILVESFTHALLPGLVLAAIIGVGLFVGAVVGLVAAYALLVVAARAPRTTAPVATSISVTTLVAIGALMASAGPGVSNFESLLFGDPLASRTQDIVVAGALAAGIAIALVAMHDRFAALAFDPLAAKSLGINTRAVSAVALALLALAVAVAANVAGSLLALAFVTGPACGSAAVTTRLNTALTLSAIVGGVSGLIGMYVSYYADWPASASIAVVISVWTACALAAGRLTGRSLGRGTVKPAPKLG